MPDRSLSSELQKVCQSIPEALKGCLADIHGAGRARQWLAQLPQLLAYLSRSLPLEIFPVAHKLSYNLVLPVQYKGQAAILKLSPKHPDFTREVRCVQTYAGQGMARCLDSDCEAAWMLLEALEDDMLSTQPEAQSVRLAAGVMQSLHQIPYDSGAFPQLREWAKGFERLRAAHGGACGPFDSELIARAEAIYHRRAEDEPQVLIHGDLHHFNILRRGGQWKAIDPKGLIGPRAFEPTAFMRNALPSDKAQWKKILKMRVQIFSESLELSALELLEWGFAQSLLSGLWMWEDHGSGWESSVEIASLFEKLLEEIK